MAKPNWGAIIKAGFIIAAEICRPEYYPAWEKSDVLKPLKEALDKLFQTEEYKTLNELCGGGLARMIERTACMSILMRMVGEAVKSRNKEKVVEALKKLLEIANEVGVPVPVEKVKEKLEQSHIVSPADIGLAETLITVGAGAGV